MTDEEMGGCLLRIKELDMGPMMTCFLELRVLWTKYAEATDQPFFGTRSDLEQLLSLGSGGLQPYAQQCTEEWDRWSKLLGEAKP